MSGLEYAGEYNLEEMKILSSAGSVIDIKNLVQTIEIFEDINSPSLTGNITLLDIDNVLENAPVIGQEYLSLVITTPTLDEEKFDFGENVFAIFKVLERVDVSNNAQAFTLSFCSPELLRSNRTKISKSYTDTIDIIVESVLRDSRYINTRKKLFLETTSGTRKIIAPNIRPFTFIKNLTDEALSTKYNSPYFFFYENTQGIHFKTLQGMYAEGTVANFNTGDLEMLEPDGPTRTQPNPENVFQRVLSFSVNTSRDMLLNTRGGMLGSKMFAHNLYHKNIENLNFRYFDDFDEFSRIDENPIYNNSAIDEEDRTIGDFPDAKIFVHPASVRDGGYDAQYDNPNNDYTYRTSGVFQALQKRSSRIIELNFGVNISMKVTGNTTLAAGQLIDLIVPVTGRVHDKENDEFMTGKYLITKLRHIFSQPDRKHEIAFNAVKDSLPKEYQINDDSREPFGDKSESVEINYT